MEGRGVRGVYKHYCLVFTFIKPLVMQYIHSCSTLIHAVIKPSLSKIQKKWFLKPNYLTNLLQNKTLVLLNVHMLVITFIKHPWYGEEIVLFILWREFLFCYSVRCPGCEQFIFSYHTVWSRTQYFSSKIFTQHLHLT